MTAPRTGFRVGPPPAKCPQFDVMEVTARRGYVAGHE